MTSTSIPPLVQVFRDIAHHYHSDQKRKYTGDPYVTHTDEVERLVASMAPDNAVARAAAHGHDLLEDPLKHLTEDEFRRLMHKEVASRLYTISWEEGDEWTDHVMSGKELTNKVVDVIIELTDKFTKQAHPHLNRGTRKMADAKRLGTVSADAKTVKFADVISNSRNIMSQDPEFGVVFLAEKRESMRWMAHEPLGNQHLFNQANDLLEDLS